MPHISGVLKGDAMKDQPFPAAGLDLSPPSSLTETPAGSLCHLLTCASANLKEEKRFEELMYEGLVLILRWIPLWLTRWKSKSKYLAAFWSFGLLSGRRQVPLTLTTDARLPWSLLWTNVTKTYWTRNLIFQKLNIVQAVVSTHSL